MLSMGGFIYVCVLFISERHCGSGGPDPGNSHGILGASPHINIGDDCDDHHHHDDDDYQIIGLRLGQKMESCHESYPLLCFMCMIFIYFPHLAEADAGPGSGVEGVALSVLIDTGLRSFSFSFFSL